MGLFNKLKKKAFEQVENIAERMDLDEHINNVKTIIDISTSITSKHKENRIKQEEKERKDQEQLERIKQEKVKHEKEWLERRKQDEERRKREIREREAKQMAEREAKQKAEREAKEKEERLRQEKEAREKAEREAEEEEKRKLEEALEAIKDVIAAAENGDTESACKLGLWYQHGQKGLPQDEEQAQYWYKRAVLAGDQNALTFLQTMTNEQEERIRMQYDSNDEYLANEKRDGDAAFRILQRMYKKRERYDEDDEVDFIFTIKELKYWKLVELYGLSDKEEEERAMASLKVSALTNLIKKMNKFFKTVYNADHFKE